MAALAAEPGVVVALEEGADKFRVRLPGWSPGWILCAELLGRMTVDAMRSASGNSAVRVTNQPSRPSI
jgi:hypothetical protein